MKLNVLTHFPYSKRYYLKHPWRWFRHLLINLKDFWNRGTQGWTYTDVWNWDSWFCSITPPMLRHMADEGCAYPGVEPFNTPEKWHDWLYKMADTIEHLQYDDWMDYNNEYTASYESTFALDGKTSANEAEKQEIRNKYYNRCMEINQTRKVFLEQFGKEFFSVLDSYWD